MEPGAASGRRFHDRASPDFAIFVPVGRNSNSVLYVEKKVGSEKLSKTDRACHCVSFLKSW